MSDTGYPWERGDTLYADDLTRAITESRELSTINVKSYGAKGDGSTNDYAAIAAAFAAASTGSTKVVYFPPSSTAYMLGTVLAIPNGVTLYAYPGTATVKPTPGNTSHPVLLAMGNNTLIYGLTIDGGGKDFGTQNNVVQAFNVSNAVLDHCTIQHTRGIGYLLSSSITNSGVRDCTFNDIGNRWKTDGLVASLAQAVAFTETVTANSYGNFVSRCLFTDIGSDSISAFRQADFRADTNTFRLDNGQLAAVWTPPAVSHSAALYAIHCTHVTVTNNRINGAGGNGIDTNDCADRIITGNYVINSGQSGIGVFTSGNAVVAGNTVKNSGQWVGAGNFHAGLELNDPLGVVAVSTNVLGDDGSATQLYGVNGGSLLTVQDLRIDDSNVMTGNVSGTFGGTLASYSFASTKDNRIINPCFVIDSPNEGAAYPFGGGNRSLMEGWQSNQSANCFTSARSTATVFSGGSSSLLLTLTGGAHTSAAGELFGIAHLIEGVDVQDLRFGTAFARSLVLQFTARTSVAGTYIVAVGGSVGTARTYLIPFTIAANTTTSFAFVIPGDTVTPISITGTSFFVRFDMGTGATYQNATTRSWLTGFSATTPSATSFVAAANANTFNIGDVRLYPSARPLGWIQRTRAEERILCERRYRKTFPQGVAVAQNAGVAGALSVKNPIAVADPSMAWEWGSPMKSTPTIVTYNPSAANANWRNITAGADVAVSVDPAVAVSSASTGVLIATAATVTTLGDILAIHATADARP